MKRYRGPVPVEVRTVKAPDEQFNVLLQLPDGYILLKPEDARHLAKMLVETADETEKKPFT